MTHLRELVQHLHLAVQRERGREGDVKKDTFNDTLLLNYNLVPNFKGPKAYFAATCLLL